MPFFSTLRIQKHIWITLLIAVIFFFTALFMITGESVSENPKTVLGALSFSPGSAPGDGLLVFLSQLTLAIPLGSTFFRLSLISILISGAAVFMFGQLIHRTTQNIYLTTLSTAAFALTSALWCSTITFSSIPLTLFMILLTLYLFDADDIEKDNRSGIIISFLLGITYSSLHPGIRFMLPPLVLLWLFSWRINPGMFVAIPFFFIAGLGTALFLPLSAHRNPDPLIQNMDFSRMMNFIRMTENAPYATAHFSPLNPQVFIPNASGLLNTVFTSFPPFMLPFSLLGIFSLIKTRCSRTLAFASLGVAVFLHTVWNSPSGIDSASNSLITVAAMYFTAATGIHFISLKLKSTVISASFIMMFLIPLVLLNIIHKTEYSEFSSKDLTFEVALNLHNTDAVIPKTSEYYDLMLLTDYISCRKSSTTKSDGGNFEKSRIVSSDSFPGKSKMIIPEGIFTYTPVSNKDRKLPPRVKIKSLYTRLYAFRNTTEPLRRKISNLCCHWAELFLEMDMTSSATRFAHLGRLIYPQNTAVFTILMGIYNAQKRHDLTLVTFRKLKSLSAPSGKSWHLAAEAIWKGINLYDKLQRPQKLETALEYISQNLSENPEHENGILLKAKIHNALGNNQKAVATVDSLLRKNHAFIPARKFATKLKMDLSKYPPLDRTEIKKIRRDH
ncbi:MAG: tetratricopeptide repeat protein [Deltaproteobacteria bacterium]|nr:tetratricopeptide repeat protein [Deltaproteobacteria bacterium]